MKIVNGNNDYFMSINLADWLSARNMVSADITEATVMAKADATDLDAAAKLSKTLGSGITQSGDDFLVESLSADFGAGLLEVGIEYSLYFGVKFSGDATFREIVLQDDCLAVIQDGIRG